MTAIPVILSTEEYEEIREKLKWKKKHVYEWRRSLANAKEELLNMELDFKQSVADYQEKNPMPESLDIKDTPYGIKYSSEMKMESIRKGKEELIRDYEYKVKKQRQSISNYVLLLDKDLKELNKLELQVRLRLI